MSDLPWLAAIIVFMAGLNAGILFSDAWEYRNFKPYRERPLANPPRAAVESPEETFLNTPCKSDIGIRAQELVRAGAPLRIALERAYEETSTTAEVDA